MPIPKQFERGNYNNWQLTVTKIMPKINETIRKDTLPLLDKTLLSMLGEYCTVDKQSIDITYIMDDNKLSGLTCHIVYRVEDFKASNVPEEAVKTDCDAISSVFEGKEYTVKEITIDTSNGDLDITFEFLYENIDKHDKT